MAIMGNVDRADNIGLCIYKMAGLTELGRYVLAVLNSSCQIQEWSK